MDFSILIPVYRSEEVLAETVRSALSQQGDFSYEIVLVEDGSPDGSGAVCDDLAAAHPDMIRVIHRPHTGTVLTRRVAVAAAEGDFIVWLDSDDLLEPACLSTLMKYRRAYPQADVILYELSFFFEDGRPEESRPPLAEAPRLIAGEEKKELYRLLIEGNRLDSLCIKAIRRELMRNDPADYAPYSANPYGEDALHCLYPLTEAASVLLIPEVLYRYRMRTGSVMHVFDTAQLDKRYNELKLAFFEPYLRHWGMDSADDRAKLKASAFKGVLDGILYFYEGNYDRKAVLHYASDFADSHPELKELAGNKAIGRKQQVLFRLFAAKKIRLIEAGYQLLRMGRKIMHRG